MSDQSTTKEIRQLLLDQLDARKQEIAAISDEDLESTVGGLGWGAAAAEVIKKHPFAATGASAVGGVALGWGGGVVAGSYMK
jgi:hypothetical protein